MKRRQGATEGQHPQQETNKEVSEGKTVDHKVNEGHHLPLTAEHPETNQHPQHRMKTEAAVGKNVGEHPEHGSHQRHG